MNRLKWFSGGSERRSEAIAVLDDLIQDIKYDQQFVSLKNLLISYENELKNDGTSVSYILSRMNTEISHVLIKQKLCLSKSQSGKIKKLREISNIRYGY